MYNISCNICIFVNAEHNFLNLGVTSGSAFKRASRQFGIHIQPKPKMTFSFDSSYPQVEATHTYDKEATYEIAGKANEALPDLYC